MFEATPGTPKDLTGEPEPKFEDSEQMSIQHLNNIPEIGKMTQEIEDGKTKTFAASSDEENGDWTPNGAWATSWKSRLPLQTIMRLLQVLVPQVEKICLDKQISDENDILKFIQQGTLVGLLPVPHPILIRLENFFNLKKSVFCFDAYVW